MILRIMFLEDEDLISKLAQGKHGVFFGGGRQNWPSTFGRVDC
jgi:hypothetical protein